jgi:hypothetical protein
VAGQTSLWRRLLRWGSRETIRSASSLCGGSGGSNAYWPQVCILRHGLYTSSGVWTFLDPFGPALDILLMRVFKVGIQYWSKLRDVEFSMFFPPFRKLEPNSEKEELFSVITFD